MMMNDVVDKMNCGVMNLINNDIILYVNVVVYGDFVVWFVEDFGMGYVRCIIMYIGFKVFVLLVYDSVEVYVDGIVKVNSVIKTNDLLYFDGFIGVLCVFDWMFVSLGLVSMEFL